MPVTLNSAQKIDNSQQWVYVTVEVEGVLRKFTHVAPNLSGEELQAYLDSREGFYAEETKRNLEQGIEFEHPGPTIDDRITDVSEMIHGGNSQDDYIKSRQDAYFQRYSIGDQLDVIMKQFNQLRLNGTPLIQEVDDWVNYCLQVKKMYPKTDEKETAELSNEVSK